MRVLIATDQHRRSAHDHDGSAIDGELVAPVVIGCPDAACQPCHGSWYGLVSHRGTPTAMVVERPGVGEVDVRARLHDWLDCTGTIDQVVQAAEAGEYEVDGMRVADPVQAVDELVADHLAEIREICSAFPVGTVLSRLGHLVAPLSSDLAA